MIATPQELKNIIIEPIKEKKKKKGNRESRLSKWNQESPAVCITLNPTTERDSTIFFFSLSQWDIFHNVNTQIYSKSSVGEGEEEQRKDGKFYESSSR